MSWARVLSMANTMLALAGFFTGSSTYFWNAASPSSAWVKNTSVRSAFVMSWGTSSVGHHLRRDRSQALNSVSVLTTIRVLASMVP